MPTPILVSPTNAVKKLPTTWHEPGVVFHDKETKTNHIACADGVVRPLAGLINFLQGHWPEPCTCKTVKGDSYYVGPPEIRASHIRALATIAAEEQLLSEKPPVVRIHLARVFRALKKELAV